MTEHAVVFYWHRIKYDFPCFEEHERYYVRLEWGAYKFTYDIKEATPIEWDKAVQMVEEFNRQSNIVMAMRGATS